MHHDPKLMRLASRFEQELRQALAHVDQQSPDQYYFGFRFQDQVRLLNLKVWSLRYKISLEFILETLLTRYRYVRRNNSRGLGLAVPTITGEASRALIEEKAAVAFPYGENLTMDQCSRQQALLQQLIKPAAATSPKDLINNYREDIEQQRRVADLLPRRLYKRPWRGNPWRTQNASSMMKTSKTT